MPNKSSLTLKSKEQRLVQLIVFRSGNEEFCIPISEAQEIIKVVPITPIPDSPYFILGLINVRGDIVAIIDIKTLFFLPSTNNDNPKHIIITKQKSGVFGLMVDEVVEVLRVNEADINQNPSSIINIHEKYVSGVVIDENRLIILLNLSSILAQEELIKLSAVERN
ncbi:chemotaxis signal transduction protein (cheW domain) [Legionella steigerwaltii]|uniref:Chemotaxis signal transduction protein (CheW domain) n=1 Tax=Legionella steigerwaltii TaxID=460 RepID=A0A378L9X5_9GAMM|nr:chemotaxis protein CheW [Legionella steigerwaltii]KTD71687.1 chemotaxis signal transduction protein (cheW domain) [Legionella steigerwaltii]STY23855.1 chemotaxis signal transduction protein (cheW domain) [Legionella steigerwaltii]